jgi:hypothetical protein
MATPGAYINPSLEELLDHIDKFFSEPFKESSSGRGRYEVFDDWSPWSKDYYNERAGPLNSGSPYSSPYGAPNGAQLPRGPKSDVSNNQPKYILPITNLNALEHLATSAAPSIIERHILQFHVLPPSRFRNLHSRSPLMPTWSQNNIQVRIAFSNPVCMLIHVGSIR